MLRRCRRSSVATLKNVSARRKKPSRGRRAPRTSDHRAAERGDSPRVSGAEVRGAALGPKPAATAMPSISVDFPLPFSPTRNVTPGASGTPRARRGPGSSTATRSRAVGAPRTTRMSGSEEVRADRRKAIESCTSSSSSGTSDRRRVAERGAQALDVRGVAGGQRGRARASRADALRQRRPSSAATAAGSVVVGRLMHAVHDQAAERHPRLAQLAVEEDRLLDRVVARRRHDQERRRRVLEQRADALGPLGEAVDHPAQRAEEDRQVAQQVDAGDALQVPKTTPVPRPRIARQPGGAHEDADRAALEEARQPARGVEEVERVARGRRVEDEHVEVAVASSS